MIFEFVIIGTLDMRVVYVRSSVDFQKRVKRFQTKELRHSSRFIYTLEEERPPPSLARAFPIP